MNTTDQRAVNETVYRALKETIDRTYPKGQHVAISGGQIVADAGTLDELLKALTARGIDPQNSLAVQAGTDYPEFAYILLQGVPA